MTALAGLFKEAGFQVTGSDQNVYPPMSGFLKEIGVEVKIGYDAKNLAHRPDLVIIGNAMSRGNVEVEAALNQHLNYISLPEALKRFFIRGKYSCVVAGTHGKTSTSSLLAWVLENAGKDPGFFIGGIPENFGRGFKLGQGRFFVLEGDEYDSAFFDKRSKFLNYLPDLVIINNIEFDHADIFNNLEEIETTFARLIQLIPGNGKLVACYDDPIVRRLSEKALARTTTFGLEQQADWSATNIETHERETIFEVLQKGSSVGKFSAPLYGEHMVKNCLAVIASCSEMGLSNAEILDGLKTFKSVRRRLQFHGEVGGIKIFDDFAHHPTEVKATICAVRERFPQNKVWAVFEPRTASSKRKIFEQHYIDALKNAHAIVLTPLYKQEKVPADQRMSLETVCEGLRRNNVPNWIFPADQEMTRFLKTNLVPGDITLFMSNGDFNQIPANLLNALK